MIALRTAVIGLCAAVVFGAVVLLGWSGPVSGFTRPFELAVAGLFALGCSVMILVLRPRWVSSILLAIVAALLSAPAWEAWISGPAAAGVIAAGAALLTPAILTHVVASFPTGALDQHRRLVLFAYAVCALAAAARILLYDPFLDLRCSTDCRANPLAVGSVLWVGRVGALVSAIVAGLCLVLMLLRDRATLRSARAGGWLAASGGWLLAVGLIAHGASAGNASDQPTPPWTTGAILTAVGISMVAVAQMLAAFDGIARTARLSAIASSTREGALASLLTDALEDPLARIEFRVGGRYVDSSGHLLDPITADPTTATTRIARAGREVAVIRHSRGLAAGEFGPALILALENESLRIEAESALAELRASRARIVSATDERRRDLERDLHDGAQQGLIAVMWRLQSASATYANAGETQAARLVAVALEETRKVLEELRVIAHGIHPAVLASEGVAAALRTHALATAIPLSISGDTPRFARAAESALYAYAVNAVNAIAPTVGRGVLLALRANTESDEVTITVTPAPSGTLDPIVADRIGALGGEVAADGASAWLPLARHMPSATLADPLSELHA